VRSIQTILLLVGLATVVATFARRIRVPAPSLLVVAGVLVALIPGSPDILVRPEIVGLVVLPPLLYAAGEELSWRELKRVWRPVAVLAVGLVLASAAAVALVGVTVAGLPVSLAFLLGSVLASTDPVAVSALGRRLALPPRLQTLVQAESLFNDATSLILFRIAVGAAVAGGAVRWSGAAAQFGWLAGGGAAIGGAVAGCVALMRRRTEDPVLETVIALVTPYGAYVLAEAAHTSGVTAVVVAGVILGVLTHRFTDARIRLQLTAVYGTVIFLLETVVFSLIGLQLPTLIRRLSAAGQPWLLAAVAITATLLLVRIAWVFPLALLRQWRTGSVSRRRLWQVPAVVSWAGARGVVPLAAALSIPLVDTRGQPIAQRDLLLVLSTAVIAISLVVQGFTLAPLVRLAGVAVPSGQAGDEYARARLRVAEAAMTYLDELAEMEAVPAVVLDRVRRNLQTRMDVAQDSADDSTGLVDSYRVLRRTIVAVQGTELARLHAEGAVNDATRRRVQRQLDLEDARLSDER
jgi:CPA1 family monovalent cation:H+ antiporter